MIQYAILFLFSFIIMLFLLERIFQLLTKLFTGYSLDSGVHDNKWWERLLIPLLVFIPMVSTYHVFEAFEYPLPISNNVTHNKETKHEIDSITKEIIEIENTLKNINNLTINQIQHELKSTLNSVKIFKEKTINQNLQLLTLHKSIEKEKNRMKKAKEQADILENTTNEQLQLISSLITRDAKSENEKSFWIGVIISFPIGVFASLLASFILRRKKTEQSSLSQA